MVPEPPPAPGSPGWWASRPQEPSAPRRGRPPADMGKIVAMAVRLVDEVGVQAFSLRMLAEASGSGTATLYRHYAGKDELMAHVADHVLGELRIPAVTPGATWQEAMVSGATGFYETLRLHPNVLPLLVAHVPAGPNGLAHRERVMQALLAYDFPVHLAARAYLAISHYVLGFAVQQNGPGTPGPDEELQLAAFFRTLDPGRYPATTTSAGALTGISLDEEFRFGLDLIITGLERARSRAC